MNILVITSLFPNNIKEHEGIFIFKHVQALSKVINVKVVAPVYAFPFMQKNQILNYEKKGELEIYHPRVYVLPFITRWINGISYFLSLLKVVRRIKKNFEFQLIHAHFLYPDSFAAVLLAQYFKVPVVVSARGSDINLVHRSRVREKYTKWILRHARKIFCVSQDLKIKILKMSARKDDDVIVNYNGVDFNSIPVNEKRAFGARYDVLMDKPIFLAIGHFIPLKNHLSLIDVMKNFRNQCRLVIIGEGPLKKEYEKRIHRWGLADDVKILGPFPHEEIINWLRIADVFVHPSLNEGIPNVVLEAMAARMPVVASRVGGIAEIIEDGQSGFLFPPEDKDRMSHILTQLLDDGRVRKRVGEAGFERLKQKGFTWESSAKKTLDVYANLLRK